MGIVAFSAAPDDPVTIPVGVTLAVGTADPIFFLPKMTLSAELIGVVEIDLVTTFQGEEVTFLFMMAGGTSELSLPVVKLDVAVGKTETIVDLLLEWFAVVATAAAETFNPILARFYPEGTSRMFFTRTNGVLRKQDSGIHLLAPHRLVRFGEHRLKRILTGQSRLKREQQGKKHDDREHAMQVHSFECPFV